MTVYELMQALVDYPPETEIMFKCDDPCEIDFYNCDFKYKKILNELHLELN